MIVLIEGLDLSGKSTLTKALVEELSSQGVCVISGYGALHKSAIGHYVHNDLVRREREGIFGTLRTNFLLMLLPVIDRLMYKSPNWKTILLHESYYCRTIAYNRAHGIPIFFRVIQLLKPVLVEFDLVLYFTASLEARRERLKQRPAVNSDDTVAVTDPELLQRMDSYLADELRSCRFVETIDNSELTPEETVRLAKDLILERYAQGLDQRANLS